MLELLAALTFVDYRNLAMVVQVEAHPNSADEYCVAASVLNRVLSDRFPNTVSEVVFAPGQYQGFDFKSYIVPDPRLINKLSSPAGNKSIASWSRVLNGRTDFKGQSMLGFRVPSEDPMCHPKGNFYHYHWQ
tara:strand:- start:775 stop:1170 length:396 start_codon:yes stop_codon:yes gene_type:complete